MLTDREEKYCQSYIICLKQNVAYRVAFDADAMNENSVSVEACRLHSNPKITLRIKELQQEAWNRNKATIDELVSDLSGMVRFDIGDLYDDKGNLLNLKDMPLHARQMIQQLDTDELYVTIDGKREAVGQTRKIRTIPKLDAIEKLMKHFGGYKEDNTQKSQIVIVEAKERQLGS